ncbi:MAG TPA: AAA family ATPase, partial [Longimicrobiales bacterium]
MRAVIRNFRGVRAADLDLSGLALVCGTNAAGKSSIAQAVAAALAGEAVPLAGLKKSEAGALVHAGTGRGGISLEADGGSIAITYPQAKVKSEGTPPAASPFAVGLRSVVDMDPKAAAATLIEYLHATPTQEDLARAVERFLEPAQAEKLWHTVADLGWDGAHERAKQTGAKLKGAWEHVTGERYGTNKADSWMPPHWATDLDGTSEETLQAALTEAREFLEAAIATTAISDAEREQLQAQADSLPAL